MEINDWQKEVHNWINEFGVRYFDEMTNLALLVEEVGELARLMSRKYGEQSFKTPPEKQVEALIEEEIGDILFVLTCLANQMDINLENAIHANINKKTERDKSRHKKNTKLI